MSGPVVVHYRSSFARGILRRRPDVHAFTIGRRVFTTEVHLPASVLRHEEGHADQFSRHGLAGFAVRYVWSLLREGRTASRYERAARRRE